MNIHLKSILTLFILVAVLSGCKPDRPVYRIGVSQCSSDAWRDKINQEIMREKLFHDDVEIEIRSAGDDSDKQISDLRYFANGGFDIICAAPNEAEALTPIIDSIYAAGIPIIVFDRNIDSDSYTSFQGADNVTIGASAAAYALSEIKGEVNAIEISGLPHSTPAIARHDGFVKGSQNNERLNLLATGIGNWNAEGGRKATDSLLKIYPQTNLIYAHNDIMAIAAAEAARAIGRNDIKVIGIDAAPSIGVKAVADSIIDATFIYPTAGDELVKTALSIVKGEKFDRINILPSHSVVDLSNAEILLSQYEVLNHETDRINILKGRIDNYLKEHIQQKWRFYVVIAILVLCISSMIYGWRLYKQLRRKNTQIEQQNQQILAQHATINQTMSQLQQATQSKLTFFTNVSHDLRTPLTLIAEPVEQLAKATNLTQEQHTVMLLAQKNVKILMRLINQILDFRRYENGKLDLNLTEVNIASQLRDWTEAFQHTATHRHLNFHVELPESAQDYTLAIDLEKMERVLFNLLSNAFKFTPENGSIKVSLSKDDTSVLLTVKDNGKGINAEDLNHIFERFFKADKVNPQGSGIGLALTKAFVELHGGKIEVDSAPGKGTTFKVQIPIKHISDTSAAVTLAPSTSSISSIPTTSSTASTVSASSSAQNSNFTQATTTLSSPSTSSASSDIVNITSSASKQNQPSSESSSVSSVSYNSTTHSTSKGSTSDTIKTAEKYQTELIPIENSQQQPSENLSSILVIDDNADMCALIQTIMGNRFMVIQASDGEEGIRQAMRYVPDLIICDMRMPVMDGLETCRRLKEEVTTSHIPVLMLTACALDQQRIQGYNSGADAYLTKPFNSEVLIARCNALIENRRRLKVPTSKRTPSTTEENTDSAAKTEDIEYNFGRRLTKLINERMADSSLTVEELAEALSMSRVQLYRKTKSLTNCTPTELVRNMRLQKADHLLKTTAASISEIGYIAGFSSPSYFIKCYREYYGDTPKSMRDSL